jgi:CRP-like cAMP-binding protein
MSKRRDRNQRIETLRTIPLVATCTAAELARVDRLGAQLDVPEGRVLKREGGAGAECFVVLAGTADVRRAGETVGVIGPGSVIGEMALLTCTPRSATVIALTPMRLLVLTASEFRQLAHVAPNIDAGLRHIAAQRRAVNNAEPGVDDSRLPAMV